MAYLAFQELGGGDAGGRIIATAQPVHDVGTTESALLSALEWSVVAIARKDSLFSLRPPGILSGAVRSLFGQPNPRLADERLEALRRIAVLSWRDGYTVAPHEVRAFLARGFTVDQYETMVDSISAAKVIPPRRSANR